VDRRADGRIESWKQIAAYLGRDVRTVQRWERKEGLPVHRHKHQSLSSVYAFKAELDLWEQNARGVDASRVRQSVATVEVAPPAAITTEATCDDKSRPRIPARGFTRLAAIGATVAAVAVYGLVRSTHQSRVDPIVKPFTTLPGGEYEPKFSPDGKRVAFVWNGTDESKFHIYTKDVDGNDVHSFTTGDGSEGSPVWSPDGRTIAFIRYATAPERSGVYLSSGFEESGRKITSISPLHDIANRHLDWSPDGKFLAVVDKTPAGEGTAIFLVSAQDGTRSQLTSSSQPTIIDTSPAFSPDGKRLAFLRFRGSNANDIYVLPITGAEPRRLTFDNAFISDYAWTPAGDEIIFSSKRSGSSELWRIPVAGGKPRKATEVASGAYFLSVSSHNNMLAFSRWAADVNIWRVEPTADGVHAPKFVQIIASTMDDRSAQYSPDGTRVAFRSNRSGADEIWTADSSGAKQVQLTAFGGPLTGTPRWSNDGRYIAFDSRPRGPADIFVIPAQGGTIRQVTAGNGDNVVPSWSMDDKWIYFASDRGGQWQIWKVPSDGESRERPAIQVTKYGGFAGLESPDQQWVYYAKGRDQPGIWRVPAKGGEEAPILADLQPGFWGYWTLDRNDLYFLASPSPDRYALKRYCLSTKTIQLLSNIPKPPPFGDSGLSGTRDGRWFLYPQVDHAESNILLVRNFR
jgi:Tol biopolymer transport system component